MPGARRGLVAPQNTFLENIIRRSNGQRKYINNNIVAVVGFTVVRSLCVCVCVVFCVCLCVLYGFEYVYFSGTCLCKCMLFCLCLCCVCVCACFCMFCALLRSLFFHFILPEHFKIFFIIYIFFPNILQHLNFEKRIPWLGLGCVYPQC